MKKNSVFTLVMVLLVLGFVAIKFLPSILNSNNNSKTEFYKNGTFINLNKNDTNSITTYMKQELFSKSGISCVTGNTYKLIYNEIEISFDNKACVFYQNNNTKENYITSISDSLYNYIANISK